MPTLDTNVLLRWLLDDVPEQTAAVTALLGSGSRFTIPDAALIETTYVLEVALRYPRPTVTAALQTILGQAQFDCDRSLWTAAIADYRDHPKLSIVDCFLAAHADATGQAPLYTFDAKLARQLPQAQLLQ